MFPRTVLLVLLWSRSLRAGTEYCSDAHAQLCVGKGTHVGCQYPLPGPGGACKNYTNINFNNGLADFVTDFINRRRQSVAGGAALARDGAPVPAPAVVMLVEWDEELAFLAQRLAEQCLFMHDHCRATTRYPFAGQAVGEARARGADQTLEPRRAVVRILEAWWGESAKVEPQQLFKPFTLSQSGNIWGHFTQLAVWSLRGVGCGAVRHGSPASVLLVCDFSHTNMLGQSTLTPGPEAPCPRGTARLHLSYSRLCAPTPTESRLKQSVNAINCDADDELPPDCELRPRRVQEYDKRHEYPLEYIPLETQTQKLVRRTTQRSLGLERLNVELQRREPSQEYLHNRIMVLENHVRSLLKKLPKDEEESTTPDVNDFFNKMLRDGRRSTGCGQPREGPADAAWEDDGDTLYQGRALRPLAPPPRARPSQRVYDRFQKTWKAATEVIAIRKPLAPFSMNSEDARQLFLDTGFRINSVKNRSSLSFP